MVKNCTSQYLNVDNNNGFSRGAVEEE